jgi:hypothetical protein
MLFGAVDVAKVVEVVDAMVDAVVVAVVVVVVVAVVLVVVVVVVVGVGAGVVGDGDGPATALRFRSVDDSMYRYLALLPTQIDNTSSTLSDNTNSKQTDAIITVQVRMSCRDFCSVTVTIF